MPPELRMFIFGCLGSAAVELFKAGRRYQLGGTFPGYYRAKGFWIIRSLMAFAAGGFAVAYTSAIPNDFLAIQIGASVPGLLKSFSEGGIPREPVKS